MTRTFTSTKQAIGYALAVQSVAAGPASRRESEPGPPPDHGLASAVFASFARAGIDPHDGEDPVLLGVLAWAGHSDGVTESEGGGATGEAIRRIGAELVSAGIVVHAPPLTRTGWRAVVEGGVVRYYAASGLGCWASLPELRAAVERGEVVPVEHVDARVTTLRQHQEAVAEVTAAGLTGHQADIELAQRWDCTTRTAQRRRVACGVRARPGRPRKG